MAKIQKTNAMRLLEKAKIPYRVHTYPHENGALPGEEVAGLVGRSSRVVYKTLVTEGKEGYFVFVLPVCGELDLKAAARAAGVKTLSLMRLADLFPVTGYVQGGCTPLGMKKHFPTYIDESAKGLDTMLVSGGKVGLQIELSPLALAQVAGARFVSLLQDAVCPG